jgi:hypothetical protein
MIAGMSNAKKRSFLGGLKPFNAIIISVALAGLVLANVVWAIGEATESRTVMLASSIPFGAGLLVLVVGAVVVFIQKRRKPPST